MYNPTREETAQAIELLAGAFSGRYGFPESEAALEMTARGFARIVWFKSAIQILGEPHETLGDIPNDADWLIGELIERMEKFPTLIQMRRLYESSFPTRDGRSSSEMGVIA